MKIQIVHDIVKQLVYFVFEMIYFLPQLKASICTYFLK